ncbi:MAG TPA: glycosyltransferase family 87 protein [Anaerolineae bacterium]|nr:glycosyltransferase family 87 protein [Anaerolineae bacterium]
MTTPNRDSSSVALDFSLILVLFLTSRLMLLLALPLEEVIVYGDYRHYFNVASLSSAEVCAQITGVQQGCLPYIDYWYEFPPLFAYLNIALYHLTGQQFKNYSVVLALVLLLFEAGNLYLLYRLAFTVYGRARAIATAWIYTALFVPLFFWLGNFDAITTFFILLGLYALVEKRNNLLAVALGLGTMVKFLPAMLLVTVWRVRGWRALVEPVAATVFISLIIFGPFFLLNPTQSWASLRAQAGKSSYQTVWAMIDGNDTTGNFGPLSDHFDPAKAAEPLNRPPRVPTWLTLLPFGLLGLFIFTRPPVLSNAHQDAVVFTTITLVIFFLWSQGWSPQWQTYLIPLLLLSFPEKRAILFIIVLGFINFLEWPVILSRGLNQLLPITIIARTLVFVLLAVELFNILGRTRSKQPVYPASRIAES